jgi:hypothetical protein
MILNARYGRIKVHSNRIFLGHKEKTMNPPRLSKCSYRACLTHHLIDYIHAMTQVLIPGASYWLVSKCSYRARLTRHLIDYIYPSAHSGRIGAILLAIQVLMSFKRVSGMSMHTTFKTSKTVQGRSHAGFRLESGVHPGCFVSKSTVNFKDSF